ncbi:MAG: response regulator [Candidatus Limivivens sp.]|nr:response regulator [Candidatus Limivivens sp.]
MNIIIVDDQRTVLTSLKNGIRWENLPIDQVYLAASAKEAREILGRYPIQIMLTDIEMPGEDGLELFAWVKEHYQKIECIFLTAHADFQYAQKAIKLGGYDYILQPAQFEDVENVIRRVCTKIFQNRKLEELQENQDLLKEQQEMLVNGMMERMLVGKESEFPKRLGRLLSLLPKKYEREAFYLIQADIIHWNGCREEWSTRLIRMVVWNVMEETMQGLACQTLICPIQNSGLFLILYADAATTEEEEIFSNIRRVHEFLLQKMDFGMAFYVTRAKGEALYSGLKVLEEMKDNNVMRRTDFFQEGEQKEPSDALILRNTEQWYNYLERGEGQIVRSEIEEYCRKADRWGGLNLKRMKTIHFHFSKAFFAVAESRKIDPQSIFSEAYSYEAFMEAYHTFEGLLEAIDYCLEFLHRRESTKADCVEVAKEYIHDHINQNISRKEVANLVFLNEEYFSRLFKTRVGMNFKDYVMKEKMDLAKKLLVSTNFSVGIIASKVGYDNFSYFSKMFKESEQMTPLDYRQMYKK